MKISYSYETSNRSRVSCGAFSICPKHPPFWFLFRMETNIFNSPLFFPHANLEHTELLADVGQTVGLLHLVLDHVESHSLGEGSIRHAFGEWGTCTDRWSQHHLPSRRSKESSEQGCYDVSSHNYTMTLHINVYRLYFFTYLR